jgi:protein-S-isoprenylcysteine O-methyltransferase Ste14
VTAVFCVEADSCLAFQHNTKKYHKKLFKNVAYGGIMDISERVKSFQTNLDLQRCFMTIKLFFQAIAKFVLGIILVGFLIFLPAGSLFFINGWLFMGILFVPMFFAGIVMMIKNPELLKKRLKAKEKQSEQSLVVKLSGLMFIAGFVVAGLDYRFGWSNVPNWVTITSSAVFVLDYALYAEVMRENAYLSRTIKVEQGQKVVDTGLYGIIRHPMYAATIEMFLMMPLILGSWYALIVFAVYPMVIVVRLKDEEKMLSQELTGYEAYKQKVKWRLIPFIW